MRDDRRASAVAAAAAAAASSTVLIGASLERAVAHFREPADKMCATAVDMAAAATAKAAATTTRVSSVGVVKVDKRRASFDMRLVASLDDAARDGRGRAAIARVAKRALLQVAAIDVARLFAFESAFVHTTKTVAFGDELAAISRPNASTRVTCRRRHRRRRGGRIISLHSSIMHRRTRNVPSSSFP